MSFPYLWAVAAFTISTNQLLVKLSLLKKPTSHACISKVSLYLNCSSLNFHFFCWSYCTYGSLSVLPCALSPLYQSTFSLFSIKRNEAHIHEHLSLCPSHSKGSNVAGNSSWMWQTDCLGSHHFWQTSHSSRWGPNVRSLWAGEGVIAATGLCLPIAACSPQWGGRLLVSVLQASNVG